MRRLFWVGVGAAAGISGYRKAARGLSALGGPAAGRRARTQAGPVPAGPVPAGPVPAGTPQLTLVAADSAWPPVPDARYGAAGRRPAPRGAVASTTRLCVRAARGGARLAGRRAAASAAGFMADVRDGMTEYLEQHALEPASTLDRQQIPAGDPAGTGLPRVRSLNYVKDGH
ncbi:MAG: hypothetical protein ACLP52_19610 [Streptosporangiaceae bacterium]